jgi:hypothetical protein
LIGIVWELDENKKDFNKLLMGTRGILMKTIWELDGKSIPWGAKRSLL